MAGMAYAHLGQYESSSPLGFRRAILSSSCIPRQTSIRSVAVVAAAGMVEVTGDDAGLLAVECDVLSYWLSICR